MKKALVLVLSCETPPYNTHMKASMETWDSRNVDGIETVYYLGRSKSKQSTDRIIYLNTPDSFKTMGAKTVEAFEWAINNKQFDYLARPNASCYVRKENLMKYVQNLPTENLYLGLKVNSCYNIEYMWGGGQYILSRDVVELIVKNKHLWNHTYTEDVSIADLLTKLGIPLNGAGNACSINMKPEGGYSCICYQKNSGDGFDFTDFADMNKLENQFFIRVKQDLKRHLDIEIMHKLFQANI